MEAWQSQQLATLSLLFISKSSAASPHPEGNLRVIAAIRNAVAHSNVVLISNYKHLHVFNKFDLEIKKLSKS